MINKESIPSIIKEHFNSYPLMEIQDIFKLIYQSAFGCEHLVTDKERALGYIKDEYERRIEKYANH